MADISHLTAPKPIIRPEDALLDAMHKAGIEQLPESIIFDGNIHRFNTGSKSGSFDKTGWYVAFIDGIPCANFGDWRTGLDVPWHQKTRPLSPVEKSSLASRMAAAKKLRDEETAKKQADSAQIVAQIWSECTQSDANHPYLTKKLIKAHGSRVTGDGRLVVPLYDIDGALSSLQYISGDGKKMYHPGGKVSACFYPIGSLEGQDVIFVAEGFATSCTIAQTALKTCVAAFSAQNLPQVVGALREYLGASQKIVVVADNDESGVGQSYASQCAQKYGAQMVMPPHGDANDYANGGGDLLSVLFPKKKKWLTHADEFCSKPAPIKWLIKGWLPENCLAMVHGQSGAGKTFVVLDWALSMASNAPDWCGNKCNPAQVLYLAGEGHHGLKARIAGWKQSNECESLDLWLSSSGCDLNKPDGLNQVLDAVQESNLKPNLIIVDTLHRFLNGDENSAQDAKTMLDACSALMESLKCAVLLVHHTGVSDDAQHRARGSSAWRGALDIEVSVGKLDERGSLIISQKKNKDAENATDVYGRLESVSIQGWEDEDGQPVTTAIFRQGDKMTPISKDDLSNRKYIQMFREIWIYSGKELDDKGRPAISNNAVVYFAEQVAKVKNGRSWTIQNRKYSLCGELQLAGLIERTTLGWSWQSDYQTLGFIVDGSQE